MTTTSDTSPTARPPRVLIVRLGAVGDVIRTLPLLHALATIGACERDRIGWLVEEPSADLLRAQAPLARVHVLPRRDLARDFRGGRLVSGLKRISTLRRELRSEQYDLVLDAHGTLKAAFAALLAGAPVAGLARGGSKEGASLLYDTVHPFPAVPMNRVRRALHLAACHDLLGDNPPMGEPDDPRTQFGLEWSQQRVARARAALDADARAPVVLFPFASAAGQGKRWPLGKFVTLARDLATEGHRVMLAWGSPREEAELRAAFADVPAIEILPPTDLVELAEVLRGARLLITGDTGPMHLAAAAGTRVLALFGPSDPTINRPWGPGHRVLVSRRLEDLTPEIVYAAALDILASAPEAA